MNGQKKGASRHEKPLFQDISRNPRLLQEWIALYFIVSPLLLKKTQTPAYFSFQRDPSPDTLFVDPTLQLNIISHVDQLRVHYTIISPQVFEGQMK